MFLKVIYLSPFLLFMSAGTFSASILGVFTSPHKSHMLVYMGVVRCLLERGHNITIITVLTVPEASHPKLRIIQLPRPPEAKRMYGIFRQLAVVAANSETLSDPRFKAFLQEGNRFDLVIVGYLFNDYQLGLAAHYNCPAVIIWTTQPISFVNRFIGNPNGWSYVPHPFVRSQAVGLRGILYGVLETSILWTFDIMMERTYRNLFKFPKYPALKEIRTNVSLVLCNHHFSEGPIAAHLPSLIEISGIQIRNRASMSKELLSFMDGADEGVILFSLGTVASARQLPSSTLGIFIRVFSSLPQRVIWKINSLPYNFTNIYAEKWLPQTSILAHHNTRLFITHGGKGSTTEALHFAVPMIAIPIFGDQFGDAYRLASNGFGLRLEIEKVNETSLRKCILEVLNNQTYFQKIRAASTIYNDRPVSPQELVSFWVEYIIRYSGAIHMRAPTKDMNTVQYYNIDVYAFCFCFLIAIKVVSPHVLGLAKAICLTILRRFNLRTTASNRRWPTE